MTDAADAHTRSILRFEGTSDPEDEMILFALEAACGHNGIYTAAFGADTPQRDVALLQRLHRR